VVVIQGRAMWAGNALRDKNVIYQGTANDVNVVSQQVLGAPGNTFLQPNYILTGYHSGDINMNGRVIFQGTSNDVEYIYQNVIKNHPGNALVDNFFVIQQQLPE
ncbi:MAG: hemagglutinin protein, partial [Bacteroidetes bacterium]|nr:hemagglutinin protein [Bacteroidota bacterium]